MLIIHKILPAFFLPLGLGILVLVIGAVFKVVASLRSKE